MARATPVGRTLDAELDYFAGLLTDLRDFAAEWEDLDEVERAASSHDWDQAMGSGLQTLDREYRAGSMSTRQQRRYCELLRQLRTQFPAIEALGLKAPTVPLER